MIEINSKRDKVAKILNNFESLVAVMPCHVYWKDRSGVYVGCNNAQADYAKLHYKSEFIGKTTDEIMGHPLAQKIIDIDNYVMATGQEITIDELIPEGITVQSKKIPLKDESGEVVGLLGISFDISERKRQEQKITEKLIEEKCVAELGLKNAKLMAASIAHELRTPLATINSIAGNLDHYMVEIFKGYETAVNKGVFESHLNPEVLDYLKNTPKSLSKIVYAANTFINMMLMKVNLDSVKSSVITRLSMSAAIDESIRSYPLEESEKSKLKLDLSQDFEFMGDNTLFMHLIFNLLKNALYFVKASQKGEIIIWLEPGIDYNYLHFKDTGKGMSVNVLANLFSAFYSNTRHGTGVGLALCKLIMHEFDGEISCDSVEGKYTHFTMSFPRIAN